MCHLYYLLQRCQVGVFLHINVFWVTDFFQVTDGLIYFIAHVSQYLLDDVDFLNCLPFGYILQGFRLQSLLFLHLFLHSLSFTPYSSWYCFCSLMHAGLNMMQS